MAMKRRLKTIANLCPVILAFMTVIVSLVYAISG